MPGAQGQPAAQAGAVREPSDFDPAHGRHPRFRRGDGAKLLPLGLGGGNALSTAPETASHAPFQRPSDPISAVSPRFQAYFLAAPASQTGRTNDTGILLDFMLR